MAALSPVLSNSSNDTTSTVTAAVTTSNGTATVLATPHRSGTPKNLRGLNKPKCSKCGNVARSRCPYQSCKSCCAKAQNPCPIHVLKANATFQEKTPSASSPMFDQQSIDASPSGGSMRLSSLRQLSNNFTQFNAAQIPLRSRRPLTRKDAANLNRWRFSKLKEYKERNIKAENEAFDRYMKNVSLLEEAFFINSDGSPVLDHTHTSTREEKSSEMISAVKEKLRLAPGRTHNFRGRLWNLISQGLGKLQKGEFSDDLSPTIVDDLDGPMELKKPKTITNCQAERLSAVNDLLSKLNKARNEEDLRSCLELQSQLFNGSEDIEKSKDQSTVNVSRPDYSLPKLWRMVEIKEESLNHIDMHFSSLERIENL